MLRALAACCSCVFMRARAKHANNTHASTPARQHADKCLPKLRNIFQQPQNKYRFAGGRSSERMNFVECTFPHFSTNTCVVWLRESKREKKIQCVSIALMTTTTTTPNQRTVYTIQRSHQQNTTGSLRVIGLSDVHVSTERYVYLMHCCARP